MAPGWNNSGTVLSYLSRRNLMYIDPKILTLIIKEELAKKEKLEEYGERIELYDEVWDDGMREQDEETTNRGVVVIDI
jgi:hypothetical protein